MANLVNDMEPELLIDHQSDLRFHLNEAFDPIMEGGRSPNKITIKGRFALTNEPTQNKRLYREHLWKREFGRLGESIKRRRVYGELDHPQDGRTKLQRASHIITKLEVRGTEVYGEAEIIDTPNGRILKAIAEASGEVGISSRGFGSVKPRSDGVQEVQEDFRLDTFDFVADPATRSAYPQVFREEREKILEDEDMDLDTLKRDYPGLVREIARDARNGGLVEDVEPAGDIAQAITEAEERTRERLTEKWSVDMRRAMEVMREELEQKIRSDLMSDPSVAASKQIVERIASMVHSFGMSADNKELIQEKDAEIERTKNALADRELEIQRVRREATEAAKMAKEAAYQLHLERVLRDADDRDAVVALVGNVMEYESKDEIESKVQTVRAELERRGGPSEEQATEWEERFSDLELRLQEAEEARQLAEEKARDHERQAKAAVAKAQRETVARIVTEEIAEIVDEDLRSTIVDLTEGLTDPEEARRVIADERRKALVEVAPPRRTLDEDEADRIRARVGRGKQRDLTEDTNGSRGPQANGGGPLSEFGMEVGTFSRLSGRKN